MTTRRVGRAWRAGLALVWACGAIVGAGAAAPAPADVTLESAAAAGATVQVKGPRPGEAGERYLNVEGKKNGENGSFACFAVLDFRLLKPTAPASRVRAVRLTLTQSIARFSKDGAFKVHLTTDTAASIAPGASALRFDLNAPGGVGDQLKPMHPVGGAAFKAGKTGQADAINLTLPAEAEGYLRGQVNAGGVVRLVLVPADDDVAATYAGPGAKDDQRPKLQVEVETGG